MAQSTQNIIDKVLSVANRIKNIVKSVKNGNFLLNFERECKNESKLSLLIVGPGFEKIPPTGWGAVEQIIHETSINYSKHFDEIWILNSKMPWHWISAKTKSYSIIISHADIFNKKIRKIWPNHFLVSVSHYGLAAQPKLWHHSYTKIMSEFNNCNAIVCLNEEIKKTYSNMINQKKLVYSPNGTGMIFDRNVKKRSGIVVLGKVEARKNQMEIFSKFENANCKIDFIGEVADIRVKRLLKKSSSARKSFLGEMNREELKTQLPKYKAILLMSKGEADALVLYEAQRAGLHIIVNKQSIGSQNQNLKWVHLAKDFDDAITIWKKVENMKDYSSEIMEYSMINHNWESRNRNLTELLIRNSSPIPIL